MADCKRKTANLFSDKLIGMTWWDGVITADERFTLHIAEVKPNTEYTASGNNSVDNIMVTYYSVYPVEGQSSVESVRYVYPTNPTRSVATFTTPDDSRIKYAAVRFGSDATEVMFNMGSTAFPYEPYGWVHSLRKLTTATDTITTLPAVIYADGTNASVGLKGNTAQSGTPSPDNPITPSECGERTGNLIEGMFGGSIGATGGIGSSDQYVIYYVPVTAGETYTISGSYYVYAYYADKPTAGISNSIDNERHFTSQGNTITVISGASWIGIRASGVDIPMVNTGSSPLPFEPYGIKIPISSANTTTPVYLGEVESTRQIKKLVLDGTENLNEGTSNYYIFINISGRGEGIPNSTALSTHTESGVVVNSNGTALFFKKSVFVHSSLADFKTYLQQQYAAGTPVCVWYVLATPETAVVNEPIRKIGDYADSVTATNIPTTTGKDSFDVLTTLKPSEVSLAYTGWHDAQCKEYYGSQWV